MEGNVFGVEEYLESLPPQKKKLTKLYVSQQFEERMRERFLKIYKQFFLFMKN